MQDRTEKKSVLFFYLSIFEYNKPVTKNHFGRSFFTCLKDKFKQVTVVLKQE